MTDQPAQGREVQVFEVLARSGTREVWDLLDLLTTALDGGEMRRSGALPDTPRQ